MSMPQVEISSLEKGRSLLVSAGSLQVTVQVKTEDHITHTVDLSVAQAAAFGAALTEAIEYTKKG